MSETRIKRIKEGKDNLLKDDKAFLIKKGIAYSRCLTEEKDSEENELK